VGDELTEQCMLDKTSPHVHFQYSGGWAG